MKKYRTAMVVTLLFTAIASSWIFIRKTDDVVVSNSLANESVDRELDQDISTTNSRFKKPADSNAVGPYGVQRAADLLRPGLYPPELSVDHEQMLKRSIAACAQVPPEMQAEMQQQAKSMVASEKRSIMIWQAFVQRYCQGFSESQATALLSSQFEKRVPNAEDLAVDLPSKILVESGNLSGLKKEDAEALDGILRKTQSPQIFEQSAFFLLSSPRAPETYLADLDEATRVRAINDVAIIHNAVTTARCHMFGGCDSSHLLAMQSCYPNECRYDSRYGDKSAAELSPNEREIANLIATRIVAQRQ